MIFLQNRQRYYEALGKLKMRDAIIRLGHFFVGIVAQVSTTAISPSARTFHKTVVHDGQMCHQLLRGMHDGSPVRIIILLWPAASLWKAFMEQSGYHEILGNSGTQHR